jgi:TDG/mug DNA glycosylase family protein
LSLTSDSMPAPFRPTPEQLAAAAGMGVPDVIADGLRVLFCGINPSLYSAAVGHHFGRPGNRFWPVLHRSGFIERLLSPFEDRSLLARGCGITNLVERATATAAELAPHELREGRGRLEARVLAYGPRVLAVLGAGAYRSAFAHPQAALGRQAETIGPSVVWLLPNPSGLNAHYQLADLARLFRELLIFCSGSGEDVSQRLPEEGQPQ